MLHEMGIWIHGRWVRYLSYYNGVTGLNPDDVPKKLKQLRAPASRFILLLRVGNVSAAG